MYYVYILECCDKSLYIGFTENLEIRLKTHNAGSGALFTKNRRPVKLIYSETVLSKSVALKRERQLKSWTLAKKRALIDGDFDRLRMLAKSYKSKKHLPSSRNN